MRKIFLSLFLLTPIGLWGADGTVLIIDKLAPKNGAFVGIVDSSQTLVNTSNFGGNLSGSDTTVQDALETIDALSIGGGTSDSLGSHVATKTITGLFGIQLSTITVTSFDQSGAIPYTALGSSALVTEPGFNYDDSNNILAVENVAFGTGLDGTSINNQGTGIVSIEGIGGSNNEILYFDFESVANQISLQSFTDVSTIVFTGMTINPSSAVIESNALIKGVLSVRDPTSTGSYMAFDSVNVWPALALGSNDPAGSQEYGINFVLQGEIVSGMGRDISTGYFINISSDGTSDGRVRRFSIGTQSNQGFTLVNSTGGRMFDITPSTGFFAPPMQFPSTATFSGISVSSIVIRSLNCSGNSNGGALTTNAQGQLVCSDDDSTAGSGGSDSLGSHVSTKSITAQFGIDVSTLTDSRFDVYSASSIPNPSYNIQELRAPTINPGGIGDLSSYRSIESNNAVTGGIGISGVCYVPPLDRIYLVDNNALGAHILRAGDMSVRIGSITLSGFNDPEGMEFITENRDASGDITSLTFAVSEEQLNEIVIFTAAVSTAPQIITKSASLIIRPTGLWTPDATEGMESITWNPYKKVFYVSKQNDTFEFFEVPFDGTFNPTAVERFDAESLWGSIMPAVNDITFDHETRTCIAIGDLISSSTNDQDIMRFNCETGEVLEHWNNYIDDAGLTTAAGWVQSEGIAYYHGNLWVSSEGNEVAWLKKGGAGDSPWTQGTGVMQQTTANTRPEARYSTDGTVVGVSLIQDLGAVDMDGNEVLCIDFERYDNNELESSQSVPSRGRLCSMTPMGTTGVQQESGGELEIHTTLGSGTHGVNTLALNMHMFNTGQVGVAVGTATLNQGINGSTWAKVGGTLYHSTTQTGNGAGSETNLFQRGIVARTFATDGDSLHFVAAGTFGSGVSADKDLKVYFGATTIFDTGTLSATSEDWILEGWIIRTGAATQKAIVKYQRFGGTSSHAVDYTTPTEQMSNAISFRITGAGTNANDVVGEFVKMKWEPAQ